MEEPGRDKTRRKGRRLRRTLVGVVAAVALLLVTVAVGLPYVVATFGPGLIQEAIRESAGAGTTAEVVGLHVSWTGLLRADKVHLVDEKQGLDASLSVEKDGGLIGLLRGGANLGTIRVGGSLVKDVGPAPRDGEASGTLGEKGTPRSTSSGRPLQIPAGLSADIDIQNLQVTIGPRRREGFTLSAFDGTIDGAVAVGLQGSVKADLRTQCHDEALEVIVDISDLWDRQGQVQPDLAVVKASAQGRIAADTFNRLNEILELGFDTADGPLALVSKLDQDERGRSLSIDLGEAGVTPIWVNGALRVSPEQALLERPVAFGLTMSPKSVGEYLTNFDAVVDMQSDVAFEATIDQVDFDRTRTGGDAVRALKFRASSTPISAAVSYVDGTASRVEIEPLEIVADAGHLSEERTLRVTSSARINGSSAGDLEIRADLSALADESIELSDVSRISGEFKATKISSELLNPFLAKIGLDARDLFGQSMSLEVELDDQAQPDRDGAPARAITLSLASSNLNGDAIFDLSAERLSLRESAAFRVKDTRAAITESIKAGEYRAFESGKAEFSIGAFELPHDYWRPKLALAEGSASLKIEDFRFVERGSNGEADTSLEGAVVAEVSLSPSAPIQASLRVEGTGAPDPLLIDLSCSFRQAPSDDSKVASPFGATIKIENVPSHTLFAGEGSDVLEQFLVEAVGDKFSLKGDIQGAGDGSVFRAPLTISSPNVDGSTTLEWAPGRRLAALDVDLDMEAQPLILRAALQDLDPDDDDVEVIALGEPVRAVVECDEIRWEWNEVGELVLAPLEVNARVEDFMQLENIEIPSVGRADLMLGDSRTKMSYDPTRDPQTIITYQASFGSLQTGSQPLGSISMTGRVGRVRTVIDYDLQVQELGAAVQRFPDPEAILAALGETIDLSGSVQILDARTEIGFDVNSPRVKGAGTLSLIEGVIGVEDKTTIEWRVGEDYANSTLTRFRPWLAERVRFDGETTIAVEASRFVIGTDGSPVDRDRKALDASVRLSGLNLTGDGGWNRPIEEARIVVKNDPSIRGMSIDGLFDFGEKKRLNLAASVRNLTDGAGTWTPSDSTTAIQMTGDTPSVILDALAYAEGYIAEATGSWVDVDLALAFEPDDSAPAHAKLTSPRVQVSLVGVVEEGVFKATEEARVEQRIMTPEYGEMLFGVFFPLVTNVEKTTDEAPAIFTATDLSIGLDGDLAKINGDVNVDLGVVRFETEEFFGRLLEATKNNSRGKLLQNWPKFDAKFRDGVITYKRVNLPIGDFTLGTKGTVDLPEGEVNLITYVPIAAATAEVGKAMAKLPGLGGAATIPLRTRGPYGDLSTDFAADQVPGEILTAPGRLLQQIFRDATGSGRSRVRDKAPEEDESTAELSDGGESDDPGS